MKKNPSLFSLPYDSSQNQVKISTNSTKFGEIFFPCIQGNQLGSTTNIFVNPGRYFPTYLNLPLTSITYSRMRKQFAFLLCLTIVINTASACEDDSDCLHPLAPICNPTSHRCTRGPEFGCETTEYCQTMLDNP